MKRRRGLLKKLGKPSRIQDDVRRACRSAKGYYALSVYMQLGTDDKPAKLNGAIFFCRDALRRLERFELPFEGRLTQRVWRIFAEVAEETLSRPPSRRPLLTVREGSDPVPRPRERRRLEVNRTPPLSTSMPPPPPSLSPIQPRRPPPSTSRLEVISPNSAQQRGSSASPFLEVPRLSIWFGGRVFVRDFLYNTAPTSALLQGGIRYSSGWLPGWGGRVVLRPLSPRNTAFLGRVALLGEFEMYRFDSLYVIPDPFGRDGEDRLPSNLVRWATGIRVSHGLSTGRRAHTIGLELKYRSLDLKLSKNPHYLGVEYAIFELNLMGELVLLPRRLWLDLSGGVQPWIGLADTVQEVGEESQTIGASTKMGVRYRAQGGLSLGVHLGIDFVFYDIQGEGRSGRVGESARDQIITINLDLGWMSEVHHAPSLSEMIQSGAVAPPPSSLPPPRGGQRFQ